MRIEAPVVEVVELSRLIPYHKNPRKKHAVAKIADSFEAFGYLAPIIVQAGTYRIVAGHGRLEALKSKGVESVPVIVADITDDQADLYTLADNKLGELSEWDFTVLADLLLDFDARNLDTQLTGFSDKEMTQIMNWNQPGGGAEMEAAAQLENFSIVIKCRSEREQGELLSKLAADGYEARAMVR